MKKKILLTALLGFSLNGLMAQELVKDIYPNASSSNPEAFVQVGDKIFFTADSPNEGVELWISDGTEAGTVLVKDIQPGMDSGVNTEEILELNGKAIFPADNGTQGEELWISDGTEAGTILLKEIHGSPTAGNGSYPRFLTKMGDEIYFNASDELSGVFNEELWKTDGTEAGTVLVKEINPSSRSRPEYLTEMNGKIYFSASDGTNGESLWATDGTEAGTVMIKSNNAGSSFSPSEITKMGDEIYFSADDGVNGFELWKSDGTTAGTIMVKNIVSGGASSDPYDFTVVGNKIYFEVNGAELWESDGSLSGTQLVSNAFNNIYEKISFKDALYFVGSDNVYGREIYVIEAANSPQLLKDIWANSSPGVSNTCYFEIHGSTLFFAATETGAYRLWQTDGTEAGTIAVPNAPTELSNPEMMYSAGNRLFFAGDENMVGGTGTELWVFNNLSSTTLTEVACPSFDFEGTTYSQTGEYAATFTNTLGYDSVVTLNLTIDCDTGSVDISNLQELQVSIYPNPTTGIINIAVDKEEISSIKVIDLAGRVVKQYGNESQINISEISNGVYMLEIANDEKCSVIRFIKK